MNVETYDATKGRKKTRGAANLFEVAPDGVDFDPPPTT